MSADQIVYVASSGSDTGTCTTAAPCASIGYAVTKAAPGRNDIVVAPGMYTDEFTVDSSVTSAPSVFIHGGGAMLMGHDPGSGYITITVGNVPTTLQDITFVNNPAESGTAMETGNAACVLRRVRVQGLDSGIGIGIDATLVDIEMSNVGAAIVLRSGSHLTADRLSIHGGTNGFFVGTQGASVNAKNVLIADTTGSVMLEGIHGSIQFSTFANIGRTGNLKAIDCSQGIVSVESSIIWTPLVADQAPEFGCMLVNDIVGPFAVAGASNADPRFVNQSAGDYHLGAGSPARDASDAGPDTDFEGDARPIGIRYDIGADEAQ